MSERPGGPACDERPLPLPAGILAVRAGHGANCSSVGSVVDLLFAASVGAGALLVAITAALAERENAGASTHPPSAGDGAAGQPTDGPADEGETGAGAG